MKKTLLAAVSVVALTLGYAPVQADVPELLHYQGFLANAVGEPVDCADESSCPDGLLGMTFRLYSVPEGGAAIWEEAHPAVVVVAGRFHVLLGEEHPVAPELLDTPTWLGVEVGGGGEMEPRQSVVSVPYALRSASADALGAMPASEYVTLAALPELSVSLEELPAVLAELGVLPADGVSDTLSGMTCEANAIVVWDGGAWSCHDHLDEYGVHVAAFAQHKQDPDAHHPANSAGIVIEPASVAIGGGTTTLDAGTLDLGPGVDDELTAAMVTTLTGGGDADALHTHAGAAAAGGVCYTAWNSTECSAQFEAVVVGEAYLPAAEHSNGVYWGSVAPMLCIAGELGSSGLGGGPDAFLFRGSSRMSAIMDCAICCR